MKVWLIIGIILILTGCKTNRNIKNHLEMAQQFREENNFGEAIVELRSIVNNFPNLKQAPEAQFQIAEIYMNDVKDYDFAIKEFQQIIILFPNESIVPKAAFMVGYIYVNYLDAYSHALRCYRKFLIDYPNHELIPSVEYEINGLIKFETVIDSLNKIALKTKESNI